MCVCTQLILLTCSFPISLMFFSLFCFSKKTYLLCATKFCENGLKTFVSYFVRLELLSSLSLSLCLSPCLPHFLFYDSLSFVYTSIHFRPTAIAYSLPCDFVYCFWPKVFRLSFAVSFKCSIVFPTFGLPCMRLCACLFSFSLFICILIFIHSQEYQMSSYQSSNLTVLRKLTQNSM